MHVHMHNNICKIMFLQFIIYSPTKLSSFVHCVLVNVACTCRYVGTDVTVFLPTVNHVLVHVGSHNHACACTMCTSLYMHTIHLGQL